MTGQPAPRFLPWLRTGLAGRLGAAAVAGLAPADTATLTVDVRLRSSGPDGQVVDDVPSPPIRLRAPGEVVAIDPALVLRRDPAPGTRDAEPNYFTSIELAVPDLPWRYTPASAADDRLQPWLALVVVEERDGVTLDEIAGRLPVLTVDDAARELPDLAQCWAWAHAQTVADLSGGVAAALAAEPSAFRSRLMCPRRLFPNRAWLACLVPAFESGRLAGLGLSVRTGLGTAWDVRAGGEVTLPVYHHWRFRTGASGDFESLVRRLTPRELGPGVGVRDLDIGDPGGPLPRAPGTTVSYLGALLSPSAKPLTWPQSHREQTKRALRETLNARLDAGGHTGSYDALADDPVVGPTAYAAIQAHRRRVPPEGAEPVWFEQLNTEPAHRAVAGLGAEIVRRDQEALMGAAWASAAGVRRANRVLGRGRLAWETATRAVPGIAALPEGSLIQIAGPAMARLPARYGGTLLGAVTASALPSGLISGAFRRATRTVRGFAAAATAATVTSTALADPVGFVGTWADVLPPAGADLHRVDGAPPVITSGRRGSLPAIGLAAGRRAPVSVPRRARRRHDRRDERRQDDRRPDVEGRLAVTRDHVLEEPIRLDDLTVPYGGPVAMVADLGTQVRDALDGPGTILRMVETTVTGLDPARPHPVPPGLAATPVFTTPMYERLRLLSSEYLVPGVGDVPEDTLGLLEVNRPFVETFLAGLNTELSREFRWREYPARLDGTWFRQFWAPGAGGGADIMPIGDWTGSELGTHNPPKLPAADLVLLIKGALPRRYPDLRVYAVEAMWSDGVRREDPAGEVCQPVFEALLGGSTFCYGFALAEPTARGNTRPPAHPGYFFVLEQRPQAPRFGLDIAQPRFRGVAPRRWNALSWAHLTGEEAPLPDFVDVTGPSWLVEAGELAGNGGRDAWGEDAAAMARITLQRPVRMLVHADSMLPAPGVARGPLGGGRPDPFDGSVGPFDGGPLDGPGDPWDGPFDGPRGPLTGGGR